VVAGAEWARWVFAGMFAALTVFYMIRLFAPRRDAGAHSSGDRTVDLSRGVMSLGMVAMLMPWLDPLPRLCWQVLFGLVTGHIAVRLIRRGGRAARESRRELGTHHELHLVVGALAMVYMFAVMPVGQHITHSMDMAGVGSTGLAVPALTWVLVAYFLVFVVRLSARLALPLNTLVPADGVVVSPHLLGSSEVVMGIGMSYMLMTML
jgi:uncharacterized protein DUF5134